MAYDELKNQIKSNNSTQNVEMSTLSTLRSPVPSLPPLPANNNTIPIPTTLPTATSFYLPTPNYVERNVSQDVTCGFVWIAVVLTTIIIWLFIMTIKISK
jgi:hypothetical protein